MVEQILEVGKVYYFDKRFVSWGEYVKKENKVFWFKPIHDPNKEYYTDDGLVGFFDTGCGFIERKMYFASIDDTTCSYLDNFINVARQDGLESIDLVEAIPDNDNPDFVWCGLAGEVEDRCMCHSRACSNYNSKDPKEEAVCLDRGNLYQHGETVNFKVL